MSNWLTRRQKRILLAMAEGATLKAHRDADGGKQIMLHPLGDADPVPVRWRPAERLRRGGYIYGNQKFPAATYLLTDKGRAAVADKIDGTIRPLGAREFFNE
ncbi:MAG: hypothetical protein ACFB51_17910 [Anaerolineae bacterium]